MGGGPAREHLLCILPWPEPKEVLSQLSKKFPGLDITYIEISATSARDAANAASVPAHIWQTATVLVTLFTFPKPEQAPDLQLIHLVSAGSNQAQKEPVYTDTDITITTSSGIHGPQIAEWVLMTQLVWSHGYRELYELQKKSEWGGKGDFRSVRDNVGRRLGVLGYGSIGRQVGRVAKAMGMDVLAYTATPKDTPERKKDNGFIVPGTGDVDGEIPTEWFSGLDKHSLQNFLKQDLDWLVIAVPLTDQTRHFLSTEEFNVLSSKGKKPVFVTNIARGPIIDQPAFIEELKNGTLAGAALDVTDPEPLPSASELWGLKNVILTPHISGAGSNYVERTFEILGLNLERREKGDRLINVVNRKRGY